MSRHFPLRYTLFPDFNLGFRLSFLISFLLYHLGKPERKKPNHLDYVPLIFIYKSDREVSKSQNKLKRYQSATKRSGECSGSGNISKKSATWAHWEKTSVPILLMYNEEVADSTGVSKTVSFDSTFSEIDFELTNLTAHYATHLPVTSRTPMRNKKNQ